MSLILGIDTGGTFTDMVIWDNDAEKVLQKSKSITVPEDLTLGIDICMSSLDFDIYSNISAVHLSTTLTVNSILENKLSKVGLVSIGPHFDKELPVYGKYEILKETPNHLGENFEFSAQALEHIRQLFSGRVLALLISADGEDRISTEKSAAKALQRSLKLQVLCCSQLSCYEDFYERTLAAITTIGLRPLLSQWADSIESIMSKYGVLAPIRVVTGIGAMISLLDAVLNPLDTILSGSAASFIGSTRLTEENDYLLLDMGGTSLDITKVENRTTRFSRKKISVGKYDYNIKALDLQSFATGGDSKIKLNGLKDIVVGPQKVTPLCVLGETYPHLTEELLNFEASEGYDICTAEETDCYFVSQKHSAIGLRKDQLQILKLLSERPHSLFFLADYFDKDADALHMDQLVEKGCVRCASLTPTDLLHAEGAFARWNTEIAKAGTHILAERKSCDIDTFIAEAKDFITKQLSFSCMQSIAGFEDKSFLFSDSEATMYLIERYLNQQGGLFTSAFSIQKPIVGVGAPAQAWLGEVAKKLGTRLIIPSDGDVAGAIGAAAGKAEL